jgi:predicted DNA-binding protein (MmcQ/YjbR family)
MSREGTRLAKLSKICLALPETTVHAMGDHHLFYVRKKTFGYFLNNHHGDGIVSFCCKVLPGDNAALVASDPARFYMPAYIGCKGWVGFRLDTGEVDWDEVNELAKGSYRLIAPKRLAAQVPLDD